MALSTQLMNIVAGTRLLAGLVGAATPTPASDIPTAFQAPVRDADYVKREEMMPMRSSEFPVVVMP